MARYSGVVVVRAPGVLSKGVLHSMQLKQAECSLHSVVLDLFRMMADCCGVTFWKQMEQLGTMPNLENLGTLEQQCKFGGILENLEKRWTTLENFGNTWKHL